MSTYICRVITHAQLIGWILLRILRPICDVSEWIQKYNDRIGGDFNTDLDKRKLRNLS